MNPNQVATAGKRIKDLTDNLAGSQEENRLLGQKIRRVENELAGYKEPDRPVSLPANLKGKVLVFDPKWQFVVLNVAGILTRPALSRSRMWCCRPALPHSPPCSE